MQWLQITQQVPLYFSAVEAPQGQVQAEAGGQHQQHPPFHAVRCLANCPEQAELETAPAAVGTAPDAVGIAPAAEGTAAAAPGTAPLPAGTAPRPAGTAPLPAGTAPDAVGTVAAAVVGTAPEPVGAVPAGHAEPSHVSLGHAVQQRCLAQLACLCHHLAGCFEAEEDDPQE